MFLARVSNERNRPAGLASSVVTLLMGVAIKTALFTVSGQSLGSPNGMTLSVHQFYAISPRHFDEFCWEVIHSGDVLACRLLVACRTF